MSEPTMEWEPRMWIRRTKTGKTLELLKGPRTNRWVISHAEGVMVGSHKRLGDALIRADALAQEEGGWA